MSESNERKEVSEEKINQQLRDWLRVSQETRAQGATVFSSSERLTLEDMEELEELGIEFDPGRPMEELHFK